MKILTVASQKGGTGKSTLCRSLAVAAIQDGVRAGIIDADPQATLTKWASRRPVPAPTLLSTVDRSLSDAVKLMRDGGAELVVIDTPPHLRPLIGMAAQLSTGVMIPIKPSPDDLEAVAGTIDIVRSVGRRIGLVINLAPSRSSSGSLMFARSALATFSCPICPIEIADRIAHQHASAGGETATEFEPNGKAATEIGTVWRWVRDVILVS